MPLKTNIILSILSIIALIVGASQLDKIKESISSFFGNKTKTTTKYGWFEGAKIYQVFIDRFAGHKANYTEEELRKLFLYGNLKSLITKLDYIKSMNFDTIWITPFYVNQPEGYHGYHSENYNHVDPRFAYGENIEDSNVGDNFDPDDAKLETGADLVLKNFVKECHKRNLKVMMDFVANHCFSTHPLYQVAWENADSKYRNWFYIYPKDETHDSQWNLGFLDLGFLPKLNLSNPEVRKHLITSTEKFLGYGIDAVRIDHAIGPKPEDLKLIIDEIHKNYPNVPFIGEILPVGISYAAYSVFGTTEEILKKLDTVTLESLEVLDDLYLQYANVLDGILDFTFLYYVDFFVKGNITEEKCYELLEKHYKKFENTTDFFLLKNLDSHDEDRIMFRCTNNMSKFQKAMKMLYKKYLNNRDLPVIYYGTEDFMTQEKTIHGESYGDHRVRLPMQFGREWLTNFFKEN